LTYLYNSLNALCEDDKEIMLVLSALYNEVYTPKLISQEINLSVNEVNRIMKKLRRRVRPLYNNYVTKG
jgi:transcription initiation factor IIE alpha subunit